MSIRAIAELRRVPAKKGQRVRVDGKPGRIVSASGGYLNVLFDGQKNRLPCHPTWRFEYEVDGEFVRFGFNESADHPKVFLDDLDLYIEKLAATFERGVKVRTKAIILSMRGFRPEVKYPADENHETVISTLKSLRELRPKSVITLVEFTKCGDVLVSSGDEEIERFERSRGRI